LGSLSTPAIALLQNPVRSPLLKYDLIPSFRQMMLMEKAQGIVQKNRIAIGSGIF
jgi:hypothetical protein